MSDTTTETTTMKARLKVIKNALLEKVEEEVNNGLCCTNAAEMGEVMDMLKDIEEIMYYHTVTKAMHEKYFSVEDTLPSDAQPLTK